MPRPADPRPNRRATNVTLPAELLREARRLGLNVSQACERGLKAEVGDARAAQWRAENRDAICAYNGYIERNGLPLEEFRQF